MCRYIIFTFLAFTITLCKAQSDSMSSNKVKGEVLFNVSDALGRATGNVNSGTRLTDQIMFGAKVVLPDGRRALRFGTNFDVTRGNEFGGSFQRESTNAFYSLSAGLEYRKKLSEHFEYFYGGDLQYYSERSSAVISFRDIDGMFKTEELSSVFNGPGAAALMGFKWNINKRFALYTEAIIAVQAINKYRYITNSIGQKSVLEDNLELNIRPVAPGAIFLTFSL